MARQTFCFAVLALMLSAVTAEPLHAEEPTALIMVDGSGSMWARFETEAEKRAKIDVVRDLLKPIVTSAGQSRIGLASYGHRRKGDCTDVEIIAPPGVDRAPVLEPLEKLNPKGKGPLAEGLRQAATALGTPRPASILAITDGADNCRQDACAAAADVAKSSPGLPVHVVAIGVEAVDLPRLQCIAKETGGKFYDVRDPVALAAAINEAASLALSRAPAAIAAEAEGATPTPAQRAGASLRATLHLAPKAPPLAMTADWRIEKTGSEEPPRHIAAAQVAESLPPGTYDVEAKVGDLTSKTQVVIEAGKPADAALYLNAARLKVAVQRKGAGKDGDDPLITIAARGGGANGTTVWIGRRNAVDLFLPPATYAVAVADGQTRQEREVALELGAETAADFTLDTGRIALSAVAQDGGTALSDVTFSISVDDPESPEGRREMFRSRASSPEFTLPPGTYYVAATSGSAEIRQRVALSAGDTVKKSLVLLSAKLKATAQVCSGATFDGAGLVYRIYALEGGARQIARSTRAQIEEMLNPGKYRLVAALESHAVYAVQDVVLEAGKDLDVALKIDCGEIGFKPPPAANAISPGEAFWEIRDPAGKSVWHATVAEPKVLLAPGRYTVRVEVRDHTTEAAFEVRSGDKRLIELGGR